MFLFGFEKYLAENEKLETAGNSTVQTEVNSLNFTFDAETGTGFKMNENAGLRCSALPPAFQFPVKFKGAAHDLHTRVGPVRAVGKLVGQ
jgi:hypothetical protein